MNTLLNKLLYIMEHDPIGGMVNFVVNNISEEGMKVENQPRAKVHDAVLILCPYANYKNHEEANKVAELVNQNSFESDLEALHLMFRRRLKIGG